jgi:hypothetical protein
MTKPPRKPRVIKRGTDAKSERVTGWIVSTALIFGNPGDG